MKKRPADIIILHNYTKNYEYRLYRFWDMARDECNFYSSFWTVFCSFTPLTAQKNQHFKTNEKNAGRYHHFTHVYQKLWLDEVRFLRYGERQADGRRKWHIEVDAPTKNFITLKYQFMIYHKNFITLTLLDIRPKAFLERG